MQGQSSAGFRPQRGAGRFNPPAKPHVKGLVKAGDQRDAARGRCSGFADYFHGCHANDRPRRGCSVAGDQPPPKKNDDNRDIVVSITREGTVYVGADRTPIDKLGDAVAQEKRRYPGKGVFLKADERLDYGQARRVMDAIHGAGVEDVQLGTDEATSGGAPGAVR